MCARVRAGLGEGVYMAPSARDSFKIIWSP